MKRQIALAFLLASIILSCARQNPKNQLEQAFQLSVMSYNVRHCAGMDLVVNYDRTAAVITEQQPDAVALQELDSMTGRSGQSYQLGELAKHTHYHPVFGSAIDYDGGKYGVGILTRELPLSTKRIPLPGDWNDTLGSALLQEMTKQFTILSGNAPTFPADEPKDCIDYIAAFNTHPAEAMESCVIEEPEASDHRPLVVKLRLVF